MKGSKTHEVTWRIAKAAIWISTSCGLIVGLILRIPIESKSLQLIKPVIREVHEHATLLIVAFMLTILIAQFIKERTGNPWAWRITEDLIDELRRHCISDAYQDEPVHHHRVTLFRFQHFKLWPVFGRKGMICGSWRFPWTGWLVPISRSGHTTQRTKAVFLVPDDADAAEGVAGQTWICKSTLTTQELPEPSLDDTGSISSYAQGSWVSVEFVRNQIANGKLLPRCMTGIPVEKDNKAWGVIVIDSVANDGVRDSNEFFQASVITQKVLGNLANQL